MQSNLVSYEPVTCEVLYMTATKKEERNGNTDVCMNQSYDRQGHKERVLLKPNQQTGISGSPENTGLNKGKTIANTWSNKWTDWKWKCFLFSLMKFP